MQRSMTFTSAVVLGSVTAIAVVVSACADPQQQQNATSPSAYPQQGGYYPQQQQYPQQQAYPQQQPGYPQQQYPQQQPGYPQQQPTAYPTAQPTAAPTAQGTMATPGPLALACQADSACGLHRCNTQFQKCAFPCVGAVDCAAGNQCTMGVCTPSMGGH